MFLDWVKRCVTIKNRDNPLSVVENQEITFSKVSYAKNNVSILKNLSVSLNDNRIGIIGNNGSGKSTLVRMINGLNIPTEGEVNVFGYDTVTHIRMLPQKVGFIFQNPDHQIIFPTVLEEMMFGLEQIGVKPEVAKVESKRFLKENQCEYLADRSVHVLSEGQKQLICILSILIMQPALLILDEPFSSIDLPTRQRLMALITEKVPRLLMVSHDLQAFADFDRLIWLHNGSIKMDGDPAAVVLGYQSFTAIEVQRSRRWD